MDICRRGFLRSATTSFVASSSATSPLCRACASLAYADEPDGGALFDVKSFGAAADGKTIDTAAVNRAIAAAATAGGGTVRFPPGAYACHSIHLKSHVALHLELGATFWRPRAVALTPPNPMHHSKATRTSAITIGTTA